VNVETKEQSRLWMHTFTKQAENFKQMYAGKLMAAVFWDRKGVLIVEFMQQGTTIMSGGGGGGCVEPFRTKGLEF
jgi:hypothetical protein